VLAGLIAADAASRLAAVFVMAALPPARRDGLSASVGQPKAGLAAIALAITFSIAWLALSFATAILLILIASLSAVVIGGIALKRLGGQTGDVLGAASQLCQCLGLTLIAIT
jgi:adenosylcobinamide-GDP ribazoletransferase